MADSHVENLEMKSSNEIMYIHLVLREISCHSNFDERNDIVSTINEKVHTIIYI